MANISNQINQIKAATEDAELKEAIVSALTVLSDADQTKEVEDLRATLIALSKELETKADESEVSTIRLTAEEINELTFLKATIGEIVRQFPLKLDVGKFNQFKSEVEAKLGKKVSSESGEEFKMETKGLTKDAGEVLRAVGDDYATEGYVNTLRSYVNGQLSLKTNTSEFNLIVGNGFQGWTITDYIIRIREDLHTALANMMSRTEFAVLSNETLEAADNIVMVGEDPAQSTKLKFNTYDNFEGEDVELAEMRDVNALKNRYDEFLTFDYSPTFELGTIDEHGWNTSSDIIARTTDYLVARDFNIRLTTSYNLKVVCYNEYKLYIEETFWLSGNISFDDDSVTGAAYIKILIKRNNNGTITSGILSAINSLVFTFFGTDWIGANSNSAASVGMLEETANTKVDKAQGVANSGKTLKVGTDGNVALVNNGLSEDFKTALLNCLANVAWTNNTGPSCYAALQAAINADNT